MIDKQSFERWLSSSNKENSGKARSYLTALEDIDTILQALVKDFEPPSVFELPRRSLKTLRDFFIDQSKLSTSSILAIPNLHGPSYLKNRFYSASLNKLLDFLHDIEQEKSSDPPSVDRLSVALKFFAKHRSDDGQSDGKSYDDIYADVRAEASRIDGDYLVSCDYDAFRKTLNDRQVANSFFSKHTDDDKRRLGDFIAAVRQDPRDISFYLAPGNQPNVPGVGPAMLTAFLTRTRPDLFVFFTEQMFESVKFLGLTAEDALPALSTDAYNTYRGIQTAIRDRMRKMGIKARTATTPTISPSTSSRGSSAKTRI